MKCTLRIQSVDLPTHQSSRFSRPRIVDLLLGKVHRPSYDAMSFNSVPLELKQAIWAMALPDKEPEVCIIWPLKQQRWHEMATPLLVDTGFSVLMHVCQEWRNFVLSSSNVKFRFSSQAGCKVPYRPFVPEIDTLYASATNYEIAIACVAFEDFEPSIKFETLSKVRTLAVDWMTWMRAANWLPELIFRGNQNLRKVSVVFPSSRKGIWEPFQAPSRRSKLCRVEKPKEIIGDRETRQGEAAESVSMQWFIDYGTITTDNQVVYAWQEDIDRHDDTTEWFTGTAWDKEEEKLCLEFECAAFFHYTRSADSRELWEEACENRLAPRTSTGAYQEPPDIEVGRNPEEWRVNDDDDNQF